MKKVFAQPTVALETLQVEEALMNDPVSTVFGFEEYEG